MVQSDEMHYGEGGSNIYKVICIELGTRPHGHPSFRKSACGVKGNVYLACILGITRLVLFFSI
jgi:hypothetical protein